MEFQAEMKYVLDTIWLLISGALVMWMAAGFAMLEAGMVRTKNVTAILTKNIALYSVACIAFYLIGYNLMYGEGNAVFGSGFGAQRQCLPRLRYRRAPEWQVLRLLSSWPVPPVPVPIAARLPDLPNRYAGLNRLAGVQLTPDHRRCTAPAAPLAVQC